MNGGTSIRIVMSDLALGGAERVMLMLARQFSENCDVEIICLREADALRNAVPQGVRLRVLAPSYFKGIRLAFHAFFFFCREFSRNHKVVYLTTGTGTNLLACAARAVVHSGATLVIREACASRNSSSKTLSILKKALYRYANGAIGVSDGVAKELAEITNSKVMVKSIPNPVDAGKLKLLAEQADTALSVFPHRFILSVGRLVWQKNFTLLIDAYSLLAPIIPQHLVLIGAGPLENAITKQIELLGLQGRVHLLGEQANPHPWFRRADAFALSSETEGYPNVLLEALAHGIPVVATDCPFGPRQILADGRYGHLVPIGNTVQMAETIKGVLNGSLVSASWDATAFSIKNIANAYLDLLHEAKQ